MIEKNTHTNRHQHKTIKKTVWENQTNPNTSRSCTYRKSRTRAGQKTQTNQETKLILFCFFWRPYDFPHTSFFPSNIQIKTNHALRFVHIIFKKPRKGKIDSWKEKKSCNRANPAPFVLLVLTKVNYYLCCLRFI